jgi:hypothetical protein
MKQYFVRFTYSYIINGSCSLKGSLILNFNEQTLLSDTIIREAVLCELNARENLIKAKRAIQGLVYYSIGEILLITKL